LAEYRKKIPAFLEALKLLSEGPDIDLAMEESRT
jgi:hypothetical protein